jgi:hypothetical protein
MLLLAYDYSLEEMKTMDFITCEYFKLSLECYDRLFDMSNKALNERLDEYALGSEGEDYFRVEHTTVSLHERLTGRSPVEPLEDNPISHALIGKYIFAPYMDETINVTENDELEAIINAMSEQTMSLSSMERELCGELLKFYQDALDKGEAILVRLR